MAKVKASEAAIREGVTRVTILDRINKSFYKTAEQKGKLWYIDDSELPAPKISISETQTEPTVDKTPAVTPEMQAILTRKAIAEIETQAVEAEMKLAEVQGSRDKPGVLTSKGKILDEREGKLDEREKRLVALETQLAQRSIAFDTRQLQINNQEASIKGKITEAQAICDAMEKEGEDALSEANKKIAKMVSEAETDAIAVKTEAENYVKERESHLKEIESTITQANYNLSLIQFDIGEIRKGGDEYLKKLKQIQSRASGEAYYYYNQRKPNDIQSGNEAVSIMDKVGELIQRLIQALR